MLVTTEDLEAVPARLKDLSYSSLLEFHSCPRRNQLNRLRVNQTKISSVTFSFGHVVGLGMQLSMQGKDWDSILFDCFLMSMKNFHSLYSSKERLLSSSFFI